MANVRVLVVEDNPDTARTLGLLLSHKGYQVQIAHTGPAGVKVVQEWDPAAVLCDIGLPGMDGIEGIKLLKEQFPELLVIMLTIYDDDERIFNALCAGACGYLLKDSSIQDLMQGIRAASIGESLISPNIASKVLQRVRSTSSVPAIAETIRAELSDREIEVLKLIANGKDNAMIAGELHISPKTVKNHISNILMKLQIDNRIQAAVYAVRSGIV